MKNSISNYTKRIIFIISLLLITSNLSAQENDAYVKAKTEIEETFGTFFIPFKSYPKHALASAWENYKQLSSKETNISSKNKELIQVAVASQIPCVFCVYVHTIRAKVNGATDEEVKEAIALAARTSQWSTILQGSGISFEDFKTEVDTAMKYMEEKAKK
jgi:AhpD family alkylhydroperoxidase